MFRQNWRSIEFWRWLWQRRVSRELKTVLALLLVVLGGALGYAVATHVAAVPAPDAALAGVPYRAPAVAAPFDDVPLPRHAPAAVRIRTLRVTVTRRVPTTRTFRSVSTVVERVPVTMPVTVWQPPVVRTATVQAVRTVRATRTVHDVRTVSETETAVQTVTAPPQVVTETVTVVVRGGHHHGH